MIDLFPRSRRNAAAAHFPLAGTGAMAGRMRAFDWGRTALGAAEEWTPSLRLAVRWLLAAKEPMCLWWGPDRVTLMNDACVPLFGAAHATGLGMPAASAWRELWPEVSDTVAGAFERNEAFAIGPVALSLDGEHGPLEAHFRISGTPLGDDDTGMVEGVLCGFADVTAEVIGAREMRLLDRLVQRRPAPDAFHAVIDALARAPAEFPFAGIYLREVDGGHAVLASCTGIAAGHSLMPATVAPDCALGIALREAVADEGLRTLPFPEAAFGSVPTGPWSRPPREAIVLPLAPASAGRQAVLVAALNPFRALDAAHRRFLGIVASQASAQVACAEGGEAALATQLESLTRLHALALRLGGIAGEREALDAILETAVEATGGSSGIVWLQDPQNGDLVAHATRGLAGARTALFARISANQQGGSAGNAFARAARWVVGDTDTDPLFTPYREAARAAGFRSVHSTPIVTRSGALLGVLSVHHAQPSQPSRPDQQVADVCARHAADAIEVLRSQEMLRESERLYRAIGESIQYGVWTADGEGNHTYVSDALLQLTGVARSDWNARWREIVHPDDAPGFFERLRHCVATGEQLDQEYRVRCADGLYRTILMRGVPVRGAEGGVAAWAGINLDIERLKQAERELRELDLRKDEFIATLAHELRNPLAPLRNGLEVLRLAGDNPAMGDKARAMMERQLAQMVRLVDDLLDVSRVSRGKIELRREPVELALVLRNAIETSQPLLASRGHELVVSIPRDSIRVDADTTRMSQVFWNLLNNAAKYTEPGGRIELAVRGRAGKVSVSIRDNGIGIPAQMQARVFDIFTQVDRTLEKSQGGLGIGLSIAKRLVEMHGGTIRVKSAGRCQGSEFIVTLPAIVSPGALRERLDVTGAHPRLGGPSRRVLVADDNPDSAASLSLMLEVLGNEVRVAHDGEEAFAAAAEFHPDVILLDIGMPKLNGYGACQMIRAQPWGQVPSIVAVTGWGQEEDKARARAAGFDRHLLKPVEPAMLEEVIREACTHALP